MNSVGSSVSQFAKQKQRSELDKMFRQLFRKGEGKEQGKEASGRIGGQRSVESRDGEEARRERRESTEMREAGRGPIGGSLTRGQRKARSSTLEGED